MPSRSIPIILLVFGILAAPAAALGVPTLNAVTPPVSLEVAEVSSFVLSLPGSASKAATSSSSSAADTAPVSTRHAPSSHASEPAPPADDPPAAEPEAGEAPEGEKAAPANDEREEPLPPAPLVVPAHVTSAIPLLDDVVTLVDRALDSTSAMARRALGLGAGLTDAGSAGSGSPESGPFRAAAEAVADAPASSISLALGAVGLAVIAGASAWSGSLSSWSLRLRRLGILALAPLYTRLRPGAALDHEGRERIFAIVRSRPGISLAGVTEEAGVSRTAVVHHLRVLEREGLAVSRREGRTRHYFQNGGAERPDLKLFSVLENERTREIAGVIASSPGLDQTAICTASGMTPSLAHFHLKKLVEADVVTRVRDGRRVRYAPGPALPKVRHLGMV